MGDNYVRRKKRQYRQYLQAQAGAMVPGGLFDVAEELDKFLIGQIEAFSHLVRVNGNLTLFVTSASERKLALLHDVTYVGYIEGESALDILRSITTAFWPRIFSLRVAEYTEGSGEVLLSARLTPEGASET